MVHTITPALRILARFWLEELKPDGLELIQTLPELEETMPPAGEVDLTELAVEYQRLIGFNLPPYESVFIDPSAMLMAPATERVRSLYQEAGWTPPSGVRTGAPDHLGLELLALADWLDQGPTEAAHKLQTRHLALWAPLFVLTLLRLNPQPFYARLGELTLDLLLTLLPAEPVPPDYDPFPDLPPPPTFRGSDEPWPQSYSAGLGSEPVYQTDETGETEPDFRRLVKRLLRPREAGLYMTRDDIARLSHALDLPGVMGERYRMVENLLRSARQYDQLPSLIQQLSRIFIETDATYAALVDDYPGWRVYASGWQQRLSATQTSFTDLTTGPSH